MLLNAERLKEEFLEAAKLARLECPEIEHEHQRAPHKAHGLPQGKCAVYVFSLSARYGQGCTAGEHRVLKIGKAGPKTNARFQSQHYTGSAPSTLHGSLLRTRVLWPYLGITNLVVDQTRGWIEENTDRDNFYLPGDESENLAELERYLKGRLGPVFEG